MSFDSLFDPVRFIRVGRRYYDMDHYIETGEDRWVTLKIGFDCVNGSGYYRKRHLDCGVWTQEYEDEARELMTEHGARVEM